MGALAHPERASCSRSHSHRAAGLRPNTSAPPPHGPSGKAPHCFPLGLGWAHGWGPRQNQAFSFFHMKIAKEASPFTHVPIGVDHLLCDEIQVIPRNQKAEFNYSLLPESLGGQKNRFHGGPLLAALGPWRGVPTATTYHWGPSRCAVRGEGSPASSRKPCQWACPPQSALTSP